MSDALFDAVRDHYAERNDMTQQDRIDAEQDREREMESTDEAATEARPISVEPLSDDAMANIPILLDELSDQERRQALSFLFGISKAHDGGLARLLLAAILHVKRK